MDLFISFTSSLFSSVSAFLLTPPMNWFVGIMLVMVTFGFIKRILNF